MMDSRNGRDLKDFKPTGAVAFFLAMVAMYALMWFSIYFLLISSRGG